ncbi:DUF1289 domain-containing protein [Shewanella sp.]|uniref:DUF1289 domain-containing protein n=1 Tax=Shewanella sp. TaxID=50422 RepID=UPI003A897091
MRSGQNNHLEHPCVRNCCLDQQDICMGCFRHLDEILAWSAMTQAERYDCSLRMAERKAVFEAKRSANL